MIPVAAFVTVCENFMLLNCNEVSRKFICFQLNEERNFSSPGAAFRLATVLSLPLEQRRLHLIRSSFLSFLSTLLSVFPLYGTVFFTFF
jgi:hypothetical protein